MRDKARIQEKTDQLINMTTEFCEKYLDDEYAGLCEKLIQKMSRKRKVPFLSGRIDIWAAGIIFALGRINFLFDKSSSPYTTRDELCTFFTTSKSTASQKARNIIDMLKLTYFDDDFSTKRTLENDPFKDYIMVDGLIMPKEVIIQKILEAGINDTQMLEAGNDGAIPKDMDKRKKNIAGQKELPLERWGNELLQIIEIDDDQWRFENPRSVDYLDDEFYDGVDLLEGGRGAEAKKVFRDIIERSPQHIDAYHHLAMACDTGGKGKKKEALKLWEEAVDIGKKCFPVNFSIGKSLLEWGWIENRPFLRACHGLGLAYIERGEIEKSLSIFKELISLNPNDNQGIRGLVIETSFMLNKPGNALEVCELYPDDGMSDTLYGRPLALFQLGKEKDAEKAMRDAIKYLPLVAKELTKRNHRKPKGMEDGYVTAGGADEAFDFWQRFGQTWKETKGAIDLIEKCQSK